MPTLREVRDAVFPAASPVDPVPPDALDAAVGWVRVLRARVPAFDVLERGDLVIVPASALPVVVPAVIERADLAAAFAASGVAAVVVASPIAAAGASGAPGLAADASGAAAPSEPSAPEADLARAVARADIPAFLLAGAEPGALERSLIGYLVNRRAELELQAGRLESRLQSLALAGADLAALVAEVATFLGRAVALEGRRRDRLAVHANADDPAAAGAVGRYLAGTGSIALRIPLPTARGDHPTSEGATEQRRPARPPVGFLLLLGDRPATELERLAGPRIAGALALELARDEAVRRASDGARDDTLPSDGPPWIVLVARQAPRESAQGSESDDGPEAIRRELRMLAPARRLALRGSVESLELRVVLAVDPADPAGSPLAERIADLLGRTVAVSAPFDSPGQRAAAEAEARATLEAVETLAPLDAGREAPTVARADRLAAYRMLGAVHNIPDGPRIARALLAPLLAGRPDVVRARLATLRAVLDCPGPAEAAAHLGIHRNTLAYRIRRLESLTGWRLGDPSLRLPLSLAVRLVQDAQRVDGRADG